MTFTADVDGVSITYKFARRRYGYGRRFKIFTWLEYFHNGEWKTYGDPWPKPRLNKAEVNEALAKIAKEAQ